MKQTCLCCGYKTLEYKNEWGAHGICEICWWQDDDFCWGDPKMVTGANGPLNLHQAQRNFILFGACEGVFVKDCISPNEYIHEKDKDWEPFLKTYRF